MTLSSRNDNYDVENEGCDNRDYSESRECGQNALPVELIRDEAWNDDSNDLESLVRVWPFEEKRERSCQQPEQGGDD